jgi:DNA repair protein RecO (recombination protein O)
MPLYQTVGIVIGRTNFGEADRIVRFITPDHGKLSAVAKGVRKIKSRAAGHLELFGQVALTLSGGHNLDTITAARLEWYPHQLIADYDRLQLAYVFGRLIDRVAQERHAQGELYHHLAEALRALDAGAGGPLPELWFKLRLLQLAGYRPELTGCLVCGRREATSEYAFDAPRGGIVCENDAGAESQPMTASAIKLWRILSDYPYVTVAQIAGGPSLAAATLSSCNTFYEHHLNLKV